MQFSGFPAIAAADTSGAVASSGHVTRPTDRYFLRDTLAGSPRKMADFRGSGAGIQIVKHRPVTCVTEEDNQ